MSLDSQNGDGVEGRKGKGPAPLEKTVVKNVFYTFYEGKVVVTLVSGFLSFHNLAFPPPRCRWGRSWSRNRKGPFRRCRDGRNEDLHHLLECLLVATGARGRQEGRNSLEARGREKPVPGIIRVRLSCKRWRGWEQLSFPSFCRRRSLEAPLRRGRGFVVACRRGRQKQHQEATKPGAASRFVGPGLSRVGPDRIPRSPTRNPLVRESCLHLSPRALGLFSLFPSADPPFMFLSLLNPPTGGPKTRTRKRGLSLVQGKPEGAGPRGGPPSPSSPVARLPSPPRVP